MCLRFSLLFSSLLFTAAMLSAQDIFVTPVPGAPFSGVIHVERVIVQSDGSVADLKTIREIGRDSRGRIYNETRFLVPVSSDQKPELQGILLYDPQTRISTMLDPKQRTFWTRTVKRPPATVPPGLLYASPTGNTLPQNELTKQEDLGTQEIEGVLAHGVREVQTIPADNRTSKEVAVTDEYWYSDELRINLLIKHDDPRSGKVTMRVAEITRGEPDPARFEVPKGYTPPGVEKVNH